MIKQLFPKTKNLVAVVLGVIVSTLLVTSVNAEGRKRVYRLSAVKAKAVVAQNITAKLRSDLFNENVKFQFNNVTEYKALDGKIVMKGDGFCVLTKSNDKMPLRFETVIDSVSNGATQVKYNFVDLKGRSRYAPSAKEDKLMNALLNKISKDFVTQDVVIAIDNSRGVIRSNSKQAMVGYGDVKIKNGKWKRVEFSVELGLNNKIARQVVYKFN